MENKEREALILGALLHDIGKFALRGDEKLEQDYENLKDIYCPLVSKQKYGYFHLLYSAQLIENIFRNPDPLITNLVLSHHLPDHHLSERCTNTKLAKIIQIADRLSSGERREREEEEEVIKFKKEPMLSIFSQLTIDDKVDDKVNDKVSVELYNKPIKIDGTLENLIPVNKNEAITEQFNFKNLWDDFKNKIGKINLSSFMKTFNQIFYLLEQYTTVVPSASVKEKPEVSLFHHLKSTCAIASCLYDLNKQEEELDKIINGLKMALKGEKDVSLEKKDFLFLKGDISGIQDFIYSVTSEKALKGLRGRSFYLQLISEIISQRIIEEFNLTPANIVYLGGGNFTILLPNLPDIEEKLTTLIKEIDNIVFKSHQGKLGVVIAYTDFAYVNFIENIEEVFAKLNRKLKVEKSRKFKFIMNKEIFEAYPRVITKELSGCEICGNEIEGGEKCSLCQSFEDLATEINRGKYISIEKCERKPIDKEVNSWTEIFERMGYKISFSKSKDGTVFSINEPDFIEHHCDGVKFESIYSPEETLETMGKLSEGIKRWGALKMDVDNLGLIFSEGFKRKTGSRYTISRYGMLSHTLSLFFSLGIRNIVEKSYKGRCCVVYSGGDDLFILAPWSDLPEIAKTIYNEFRRYTCKHPKITISGGIYIAPSLKFPVYQAAKESGRLLEEIAKDTGKDQLCFLNTPLKWDTELYKVEQAKDRLKKVLEKNVSRSILTILYSGYRENEAMKEKRIPFVRIWRIFYALKRLMERHKNLSDEIEKVRKEFITDFEIQPKLDVAVRWAELLTRKQGN